MSHNDFWDIIYIDGDMDKDDSFGKWYENPKYVNEPPHVFVRREMVQLKPSTDFSIPKANPGKDYLMWHSSSGQWFVCHWNECEVIVVSEIVMWTYCSEEFTHWLPMPDAPDT